MKAGPPTETSVPILGEPQICEECQTVARLTNGLCLNCLLRGALEKDKTPSGKEDFREVLASVKSASGDWRIADHEILDEIARGGMGVVYRAKELHSGRIVALKCVLACSGDSDHVVARFRREAETAARLEHPNIVPIYQVGETADGVPYYTMKLAPAGSLLQARGPLLSQARHSAELMVKVARAVHYAHTQGVLHRDLKPGNILLDGHGEPLVSDFGLARCQDVSGYLTRSLASFGTPGYIAPEQADGPASHLTPAADVYSLGAILFELLSGRTPFVGESAFVVMKQAANDAAPKLRSVVPKADRDLEVICTHCLEREPRDRYQSADELADDLQRWLEHRPIVASAPGPVVRTRRWVRRNRLLAVSLLVLGLIVIGSAFWTIAAQKRELAMRESVLRARSVLVLPFLDLDTVSGDAKAAESIAESLRTRLNNLGPARVVAGSLPSWSRIEFLRKAAQESRSRTLLSGTVRNVDGKRRIALRLLTPAGDQALSHRAFELTPTATTISSRESSEWAGEIDRLLNAESWADLLRSDPVFHNEEAMEALTAGRNWTNGFAVSDFDRAIALFRKAIALEPNSSLVHASLAKAAGTRTHFAADMSFLELAKEEALKALDLDRNSVEASRALAGIYFQEGKFREALEQALRTMEIGGVDWNGSLFIGMTLRALGRPDRALAWYVGAAKLQERPGDTEPTMADCWTELGDDEMAFRNYNRTTELKPGSAQGEIGKARLHMLRGEYDQAREICRDRVRGNDPSEMLQVAAQIEFFSGSWAAADELYSRLVKSDPQGGGSFYGAVSYQSALGRIKQRLGLWDMAVPLLEEALANEKATLARQPSNPETSYRLAAIEASLNLNDSALQHLRQAIALGWLDYRSLQKDPRFDSLRSHPEFTALTDGLSARVAELRSNVTKGEKDEAAQRVGDQKLGGND